MSALRFLLAATVVFVAVLCAPYSVSPGVNGADIVCWFAPVALIFIAWPRRSKTPAGGDTSPASADSPSVGAPPAGPRI
ncbi:hypothetical protein [Microbacterium luteum]|uniref:hypothetical protein n=1 Tax=Microbacterium luteum TaxID=2782167 RepID=UPI00188772FB|nr:hypothetical protein [Microbacterium luteum]